MTKTLQSSVHLVARRAAVSAAYILFAAFAVLFAGVRAAVGQALPAAEASPISTGFGLPRAAGSLQWAVTGSETLSWGYYANSGASAATNVSGDVAYLSNSKQNPFSMVFAGGRSWGTSGGPSYTFLSLGLTQLFNVGRWNFVLSDSVSYVPGTPIFGLSGVAGVGDLGVNPVQVGVDSGQGVLTNYSPEVNNTSAGSVQRQITGKTYLDGSGSYTVLRFLDGPGGTGNYGLESDSLTGSAGFGHHIDARNTFGGNYAYSSFIFLNNLSNGIPEPNFASQTASFFYSRQITRKLGFSVAAGPEWTKINLSGNGQSLNAYADASINYTGEFSHLSLSYVRSTNNGYGVIGGGISDSAAFSAARVFARVWNCAANVSYSHTANLPTAGVTPYDFETAIAGGQVSRALAHNLSAYASFMVEDQTHASSNATVDLFDGVSQVVGFGVTYSPSSKHFGRP